MTVPTSASASSDRIASPSGARDGTWTRRRARARRPRRASRRSRVRGLGPRPRFAARSRCRSRRRGAAPRRASRRPAHQPPPGGARRGRRHDGPARTRRAGRARAARAAGSGVSRIVKSATVDWAIPAIPESMCFSPHAMSQNGSAFATTPITTQRRHEARAPGRRGCPILAARRPNSTTAAIEALAHIRGAGSRPPSTATLMKRYEAPHTAARDRRRGQCRLTPPRYRPRSLAPVARAVPRGSAPVPRARTS